MRTIDWRELYASNRAAIERAGVAPGILSGVTRSSQQASGGLRTFTVAGRDRRALVHVPAGVPSGTTVPLVCMLHGCTQDATSFAAATQMNAAADRQGFAVLYPQQERGDNQNCCWNWFLPGHQARGAGEPEAIAAMVRALVEDGPGVEVDPRRVFVAGLSAGAAMAAVMAATYPELFAALAVHSGLAYRSATNVIGAFAAMGGRGRKLAEPGAAVHEAMGPLARPIPTMVVHGSADHTVAPGNGQRVLEQFMAANRLVDPASCDFDPLRPTDVSRAQADGGGHAYTCSRWTDRSGALMHELLEVEGMGHAWSGGATGGSWTDPRGPDASEAIWRFFAAGGRAASVDALTSGPTAWPDPT
jgi:poly(hydroxyalkanoate) depolymerase family esterase